jgi:hypothetical protein
MSYGVMVLVIYHQKTDCIPPTSPEQRSHVTTPILFVSDSDESESSVGDAGDERDSYSDLDVGREEVDSNDDQTQENFQYQEYQRPLNTSNILLSIILYISILLRSF